MKIKKFFQGLDLWIERIPIAICQFLIVLFMTIAVVSRYIFQNSSSWSDEVVTYIYVWSVLYGMGYAARFGLMIKMDAIKLMLDKYPKLRPLRLVSSVITEFITIGFFGWLIPVGIKVIRDLALRDARTPATEFPLAIINSSLVLGSVMVVIRSIQRLVVEWIGFVQNRKIKLAGDEEGATYQ
jgi:TRAP-type C4-dicarboxylate transport system permease small subunit